MPLPKTPQPRIQIQAVEPVLDCGRYAVKRAVGDRVEVYATVFKDGHDTLGGVVRVRGPGDGRARRVRRPSLSALATRPTPDHGRAKWRSAAPRATLTP